MIFQISETAQHRATARILPTGKSSGATPISATPISRLSGSSGVDIAWFTWGSYSNIIVAPALNGGINVQDSSVPSLAINLLNIEILLFPDTTTYYVAEALLSGPGGVKNTLNSNILTGTSLDDLLTASPSTTRINGGGGYDVASFGWGARDRFVVTTTADGGFDVRDTQSSSSVTHLLGVEGIRFSSGETFAVSTQAVVTPSVAAVDSQYLIGTSLDDTLQVVAATRHVVGAGGTDTAVFTWGTSSWFKITTGTDGTLNVQDTHTPGAVITLDSIEWLNFADGYKYNVTTATMTPPAGANPVSKPVGGTPSNASTPAAVAAPAAPPKALIMSPVIPGTGMRVTLQNTQSSALSAREITFGMVFQKGQVGAGQQLLATIAGQNSNVQMDVKTNYADGSVKTAVLTMLQPAIPAVSSANVTFAAVTATAPAAINLASAIASGYNVAVSLAIAGGSTYQVNVGSALATALANGSASYWLQGAQATQARVDVPITGSLRLTFDVTAYRDGTFKTDVQFNNDRAMQANGGPVTYDVTITQNGQTAFQRSALTQAQYQTWHQPLWTNGAPQVNVQQDIRALENANAILTYDTSTGVAPTTLANEVSVMAGSTWGQPLANNGVTQYMPMTGGRPDIGPLTQANALWLLTQNQQAAQYALGQADASGAVPWHFYDPQTGQYLSLSQYPQLWTDVRGGTGAPGGLTQQIDPTGATGWTADNAHMPELSFVPFLATGDRYTLDQLNAQASASILSDWSFYRQDGKGLVANGSDQVRGQAWALREIDNAAYANPDGSPMKAYFTQIASNNWSYLVSMIPTWTAQQGEAYGRVPGDYGNSGGMAPWQQDFFATTTVMAALQGNKDAATFLKWQENFLVGRFLNAAKGFNPNDGTAYNLRVYDTTTYVPYTTWAGIEQATVAAGLSNGTGWAQSNGYYNELALESLAGIITVNGSTQAMKAYGWLMAAGAPVTSTADMQVDPTYNVSPRLPDGSYLTRDHMHITTDNIAGIVRGETTAPQMLVEKGSGAVTLQGSSGTNMMFAGSGGNTLIGGASADYLFGGAGNDTFMAGAGKNFMEATGGADTFVLSAQDIAQDIVNAFRAGTDHLHLLDANGQAMTATALQQVIAAATSDTAGNAVLHIGAAHDATLNGVATNQLTIGMFK